jgi:hypothetical protein
MSFITPCLYTIDDGQSMIILYYFNPKTCREGIGGKSSREIEDFATSYFETGSRY